MVLNCSQNRSIQLYLRAMSVQVLFIVLANTDPAIRWWITWASRLSFKYPALLFSASRANRVPSLFSPTEARSLTSWRNLEKEFLISMATRLCNTSRLKARRFAAENETHFQTVVNSEWVVTKQADDMETAFAQYATWTNFAILGSLAFIVHMYM